MPPSAAGCGRDGQRYVVRLVVGQAAGTETGRALLIEHDAAKLTSTSGQRDRLIGRVHEDPTVAFIGGLPAAERGAIAAGEHPRSSRHSRWRGIVDREHTDR